MFVFNQRYFKTRGSVRFDGFKSTQRGYRYCHTTRTLILQATEELGYHPNTIALNLRRQRTQKIGLCLILYTLFGKCKIMMGFFVVWVRRHKPTKIILVLYTAPVGNSQLLRQICRSREVETA